MWSSVYLPPGLDLCTHPPTCSQEPSHLGHFRVRLWLHQKVQGPGHELGREPEKRTEVLGQGGTETGNEDRRGSPRHSPGSLDLGTHRGARWLVLILEGRTITMPLWGVLKGTWCLERGQRGH